MVFVVFLPPDLELSPHFDEILRGTHRRVTHVIDPTFRSVL